MSPNNWVHILAISALICLIDKESTITFNATFLTLLDSAKYHYGLPALASLLSRLRNSLITFSMEIELKMGIIGD